MKYKYLTLFMACTIGLLNGLSAQSLQSGSFRIVNDLHPGSGHSVASTNCTQDTIYYPYSKTSAFQALNVNSSTGSAFAQWFPAPQSVAISGFDFFSWAPGNSGTVTVTCRLWLAGTDSLPSGTPLRSVTVNVDSAFGGGMLSVLKKTAVFSAPYTINAAYVVTVENNTTSNLSVVTNNWSNNDGNSEWLSSVRFTNGWARGYAVNVGGAPFDADIVLMPYVLYTITANFTASNSCVDNNSSISFSNTSSPAMFNPFYNRWVFFSSPQSTFYWNFGPTSTYGVSPTYNYSTAGNYNVLLTATQLGWVMNCIDTHSVNLKATPAAPTPSSNSPVCAGDSITLGASAVSGGVYSWSGPGSYASSIKDNVIQNVNSSMAGSYGVTVSLNGCTSQQKSVNVTVNAVPATPSASNNGPLCAGQDLQLSTAPVSNASYQWTGPNSFSSTSQNPVVTAVSSSNAGVYSVKIIASGCTSQPGSTTLSLSTSPAAPSVSNNGPLCAGQNLQLTASNSTGATYAWTGPNSFTSSQQSPAINGVTASDAGTYSCKVTVSGCGTSNAANTTVSITALPTPPNAGNNGPICDGKTLSLTASTVTGATYDWTGPNGYTSTSQNPTLTNFTSSMAGTYSVTASVSGCGTSNAGTTTVAYNPGPSTPSVSSNGPLCEGNTLQLQSTTISGATYSWSGPNGFSSTQQNPSISNVSVLNAGSYSVYATIANCATSSPGSSNVSINTVPSPPNVSSNSPVCSGVTLTLTASNVSGATYSWTGPGGYTSTQQNPSIINPTVANEGTYSVTAKVNGCSSPAVDISTTVVPKPNPPSVGKTGPACEGGDLNLTAATISNASYFWTGPNGFTSFDQNPVITNISQVNAGQYSVIASVGNCSASPSNYIAVISPKPVISSILNTSQAYRNGTSTYSVAFHTGSTYDWVITGGNQISGTNTNLITVQWGSGSNGTVAVSETSAEGCAGNQTSISIGLWSTGVPAPVNGQVHIYPNPVKNELRIENVQSEQLITLTDLIGKPLMKIDLLKGSQKIDLSQLPEGIYLLNFSNGITHKIIKIK